VSRLRQGFGAQDARTTSTIATALLVAAVGLPYLAAQAPVMTVLSRDGRKPLPIAVINNQEYVADLTLYIHNSNRGRIVAWNDERWNPVIGKWN